MLYALNIVDSVKNNIMPTLREVENTIANALGGMAV